MTTDLTCPFEVEGSRLSWRGDGEHLVVRPWGEHAVRVSAALSHDVVDTGWALLEPPAGSGGIAARVTVEDLGGGTWRAVLVQGSLRVVATSTQGLDWQAGYARTQCRLAFHRVGSPGDPGDGSEDRLLFEELGPQGALKTRARAYEARGATHRHTVTFVAPRDERLYGMGQYQQDLFDLKGSTVELAHRNSQVSVPFVLSSAGYGFLWHDPAIGRATFATNRTEWVAESSRQVDYWVTTGGWEGTPAQVAGAYADATGHAPVMPEHGLGFWQCKLRYSSQSELLAVAREHVGRGLPLDVIVADFFHWPHMGDYRWEEEFWPDPAAMVAELDALGVRLMVSVWPQVSLESENFDELNRRGYLVRSDRGVDVQMWFEGPSRFLDVTNPAARAWLWERLRAGYPGVDVFWLDEAEPEYATYEHAAYRYHSGEALEVGNSYPQLFSRAVADGQRAEAATAGHDPAVGPVNLVRCAWAGSQRYGPWCGPATSTPPGRPCATR